MSELWKAGLGELALHVESGDVSCREIVSAALARIERHDGRIGAFMQVRGEAALAEATAADEARAAGRSRSRLHGLPIAVKDIFASREFETTCGSRILRGFRAPYEATVLRRLRDAGLVVVGTTNMDE
ncbi:MAG: amidase family protein, partial [Solirubrobacteraceae bacterium]